MHYLTFFVLALMPVLALGESWPQFRGENGAGIAAGDAPLPSDLSPKRHLLWKTQLPPDRSSPVVSNGRIYLTGMRGDNAATICIDASSGDVVWEKHSLEVGTLGYGGGHAQCICATNGEYVISFFGSAGMLCYDMSGELIWHTQFEPFNTQFGVGSSPILVDDRIILSQDFDTDSFIMAIDLATGDTLWRTPRPDFIANFATPVI